MKYIDVKRVGKKASQLVIGTSFINEPYQEKYEKLFDEGFKLGVNTFDCAWGYAGGQGERVVGEWMEKRGNREDIVIASKCSHPTRDRYMNNPFDILSQFTDSLTRLRTNYIDIYMLHRDDVTKPVGPTVETFTRLFDEGKIRAYGGANWSIARIEEANDYAEKFHLLPITVSSINYCLAEQIQDPWGWGSASLTGDAMKADRQWYIDNQMPIFSFSTLGIGWLSGRVTRKNYEQRFELLNEPCLKAYDFECNLKRIDRCQELAEKYNCTIAQIATAYSLKYKYLNLFALDGVETPQEIQQAVAADAIPLTDEELMYLNLEI